jgi:helicase MOV-10
VTYGHPLNLKVEFRQTCIGRYDDRVELLEDVQLKRQFLMSRTLRATVRNKADHELLQPKAPYVPKGRLSRQPELTIVEGVAPPSLKAIRYIFKLPEAPIPKPLLSTLSNSSTSETVKHVQTMFLPAVLNNDTHAKHFKRLLWV